MTKSTEQTDAQQMHEYLLLCSVTVKISLNMTIRMSSYFISLITSVEGASAVYKIIFKQIC